MSARVTLLKYADTIVGRAVTSIMPSRKNPSGLDDAAVRRILIIRPGGIGDAVLLAPTLAALIKHYPQASVHVLAEKRNKAVFGLMEGIAAVYCYDKGFELLRVIRNRYDLVIDTEQWHQLSAVIARLTRAPISIGFSTNSRRKHFTHPVPYSQEDYEAQSFLHLLCPLVGAIERGWRVPFLTMPQPMIHRAAAILAPLSSGNLIAVFPGSSIRERKWGTDKFRNTVRLLSDQGYGIVVVGGEYDRETGEAVIHDIPRSLNLCGYLSLPETAAVLLSCKLLITGDSGIMHIGYGLGIRMVALFGPGRERKWAPQGHDVTVINKHLPCSPCTTFGYTPECTKNAPCLQDITPEEVVQESMKLLEHRG
jgi:ADP-heptose:LPS heptosyltransferase